MLHLQTYDTSSVTVAVAVAALMSPLGSAGAGVDNKASDAGAGQKGGQDSAGDAHRGGEQQQLLRASGRVYLLDATTLSSGITGTSGAVNIGGGASVGLGGGLMGAGLGLGGLNAAGMGVGGLHGSNSYGGSMSLAGALGGAGFGGNSANKLNKEAGRWVAVLEIAVQAQAGGAAVSIGDHSSYSSNSCDSVQVQQFNLGRFDREQDAKLALDQVIKKHLLSVKEIFRRVGILL